MQALPLRVASALALLCMPAVARGGDPIEAPSRWALEPATLLAQQDHGAPRFETSRRPAAQPVANYPTFFELSLADNVAELGYRQTSYRHSGYFGARILANDDDDVAIQAHLVRQGTVPDQPARVGVGVGAYAIRLDSPRENVYAIAILGTAEYDLEWEIPITLSAELGFAPSITTFDDGNNVKDFRLQAQARISDSAAFFLGVRILQTNTARDHRVDEGIHAGIRLAL